MLHPVQQKVEAVTRRVRRLQTLHAGSLALAVVLGAALIVGWADYLLRLEDAGLRWLGTGLVLAALAGAARRYVLPVCRRQLTNLLVAQHIERRFPQLRSRLSSSLEFLHQAEDAPTAGSPELRRAAIARTAAEVESLDFRRCLDPGGPAGRRSWRDWSACWPAASAGWMPVRPVWRPGGWWYLERGSLAVPECVGVRRARDAGRRRRQTSRPS